MDDDVALRHELVDEELVQDAAEDHPEVAVSLDAAEVAGRARREVVEDDDGIAALDQRFGQMAPDEAAPPVMR